MPQQRRQLPQQRGHWTPAARLRGERPVYLEIADAIAADVRTGRLPPAERLPPQRRLAEALGLDFTTVARAYAEAARRGLVEAAVGRGTFVRARLQGEGVPAGAGRIDMTMNLPPEPDDPALLQRMRQGFVRLAAEADLGALLRYHEFGGEPDERDAGARWLAQRMPRPPVQRLLVCPGAQSALLATLAVLARPGDVVCCEALTYPGLKGVAAQLGIELHGLPLDEDGIDPDAFAAACQARRPKALYLNPTLLNPTTAVLSAERRDAVVATARQHRVPIVEDDAYGMLPRQSPPPLAALAPELTFHVAGFAKCLGAGLRVAYLVAPDARHTSRLAAALRATTVMASPFTTALATAWIDDGTAAASLQAVRRESAARQEIAASLLPPGGFDARPEAFHLWLRLEPPWDRAGFAAHMRRHGVTVVASDAFAVGPASPPEAVRVCLGGPADRGQTRHAIELMADALEHRPEAASAIV